MKFLPLVWAGIWRRPGRAALTMISVVSAFVLFGVLAGFSSGLDKLVANAHADLLLTQSQISNIDPLPISLARDISRIPGVKVVTPMVFFGGPFRRPNEGIPALAVDPDKLSALDDQLKVRPDQWAALKRMRTGALVSSDVATLYDIKVGDRIPLHPNFVANRDGTHTWPVDVVGIYPADADDNCCGRGVLLNYGYVDKGRASDAGTAHIFNTRIADPLRSGEIAAAIDRLSLNSTHPTRTFSDRQLASAAVASLGQVGLAVRMITGAVFFALLFSLGAVMIQSARERTGEFAVLKTLGFGDVGLLILILAETTVFCLIAAAAGLSISRLLYPVVVRAVQFNLSAGPIMGVGFAAAALLALIAGAIPAWRTARLSIVDALAGR